VVTRSASRRPGLRRHSELTAGSTLSPSSIRYGTLWGNDDALYRCGRQVEALRIFHSFAGSWPKKLPRPSPRLTTLETAILQQAHTWTGVLPAPATLLDAAVVAPPPPMPLPRHSIHRREANGEAGRLLRLGNAGNAVCLDWGGSRVGKARLVQAVAGDVARSSSPGGLALNRGGSPYTPFWRS